MATPPLPVGQKRSPSLAQRNAQNPATKLSSRKSQQHPVLSRAPTQPKPPPAPPVVAYFAPDFAVTGEPGKVTLPPLAPVVPYDGGLSPAAQKLSADLAGKPLGTIAHAIVDGESLVFQVGYRLKGGHDPRLPSSWVKGVTPYRLDVDSVGVVHGWPNIPPPRQERLAAKLPRDVAASPTPAELARVGYPVRGAGLPQYPATFSRGVAPPAGQGAVALPSDATNASASAASSASVGSESRSDAGTSDRK
jgi:hypothetical protein